MFVIENVRLAGIACQVPDQNVDNLSIPGYNVERLSKVVDGTGVRFRSISPFGNENSSDLCCKAAESLIADLAVDKKDIGLVVFVSQTSDYILPATSCIIQNRLGLDQSTLAFDVNLGCSGYTYGLFLVASMLNNLTKPYALLLAGDTSSRYASPLDQSTIFLFGDAGSASLLERQMCTTQMKFSFGTDGAGYDKLIISGGGHRSWFSDSSLERHKGNDGNIRSELDLYMDGYEIFNFAIDKVTRQMKDFMDNIETYDGFVFHQANQLMIESMRKISKIPKSKFLLSLYDYGNTSSASIPLTICHNYPDQSLTGKFFFNGFGVGLSWGFATLNLNNTRILAIQRG